MTSAEKETVNKFLTLAMGECWHERKDFSEDGYGTYNCKNCGERFGGHGSQLINKDDFFTWAGFGKLWEWAQKQSWWMDFVDRKMHTKVELKFHTYSIIHPDHFTDAIYTFLKETLNG